MPIVTSVTSGFFPTAKEGFSTTTSGSVASGAATVGLNSVAGFSNGDTVVLVIDPNDAVKKQAFTGTIDTAGVQVTGVVWTEGNNQTHTAGASVVDYETATHWALYSKGIGMFATKAGLIDAQGVASFQSHIDISDTTAIRDSSDNELVKFAKTASAVNELEVANAATGTAPRLSATGGDTNIDLRLVPKGTGMVKRGATGGSIDWWEEIGRQTLGTAGDTISLTSLPERRYLRIYYQLTSAGQISATIRFNNDSAANYAQTISESFGAASNQTGATSIGIQGATSAPPIFGFVDIVNISTINKYVISRSMNDGGSGAGAVPSLVREAYGKWANTSALITRIDMINTGTGDFAIGSEVIVLGHD